MRSRKKAPSELAPIPASIAPSRGIELLTRQINAARALLARRSLTSDDYGAWETLTNDFLIKAFGSNSPNVSKVMEVGKFRLTWGDKTEAEHEQDRRKNLITQIRRLESLVESLQTEVELRASSVASADTHPDETTGEIDPRKVFVVHGRNKHARVAMAAFLRSLDLRPIEWSEAVELTGEASPFIGQVVQAAFCAAQAVIVLLTGDDLARLRSDLVNPTDLAYEKKLMPQARPNVLFEAGFAFGKHPKRTVIVEFGRLRPFSDVQGRHVIRMDNSVQKRQEVAERLRTAGCAVNTSGVDWHTAGDFESVEVSNSSLKRAINPAKSPATREAKPAVELNEDKLAIIRVLAQADHDREYHTTIADELGWNKVKTRHLLDELTDAGYLQILRLTYGPGYGLARKGRALAVKSGFTED